MRASIPLLYIVAFFSGAAVMVIELVGSRVLAPYVGASVYVWTSLIGVILFSLSAGYFAGGRLADRGASEKGLAALLFLSGVFTIAIVELRQLISLAEGLTTSPRAGSLAIAVFLFAAPAFFLGMITPYLARLRLTGLETSGRAIGTLYAVSTMGSIAGTFLGGFFLISHFGNADIFVTLGLLSLLLSLVVWLHARMKPTLPAVLLVGAAALGAHAAALPSDIPVDGTLLADEDTRYKRVWIYEVRDDATGVAIRLLTDTIYGTQSGFLVGSPEFLLLEYQKFFDLAFHFAPRAERLLMVGAGAFTYPTHFLARHEGFLDVVEIDDGLLPLAEEYFAFKKDPRLSVFHEDGRVFLNAAQAGAYDAILLDAFTSFLAIPHQLATREALVEVRRALSDEGVAIANIVSAVQGPRGEFFRAAYATYAAVFPQLFVFKIDPEKDDVELQNLVIVAFKEDRERALTSASPEMGMLLRRLYKKPVMRDLPVLTDELAPVERYTAKLVL